MEVLDSAKLRGRYTFATHLLPHTSKASPIIHIQQRGIFATTDDPALMHPHPKSRLYIRVRSWCCTFCGSGQIYIMTCMQHCHTEHLQRPKSPLGTAYSCFPNSPNSRLLSGFFHLGTCIGGSSTPASPGTDSLFLLSRERRPLSVWTTCVRQKRQHHKYPSLFNRILLESKAFLSILQKSTVNVSPVTHQPISSATHFNFP